MKTATLNHLPRAKVQFIEPMYARAVQRLPQGNGWLYEIKFDGYRALAGKGSNGVIIWSRQVNLLSSLFVGLAVLTLLWLLPPQSVTATAISVIRTPDEIVAAADSKQIFESLKTGTEISLNSCKIHKIRDNFYFARAGYGGLVDRTGKAAANLSRGRFVNVEPLILSSHQSHLSIRENVDGFERSIPSFLSEILDQRKRDNPEHFKRNFYRLVRSEVVFFGVEGGIMVVHPIEFRAHDTVLTIKVTHKRRHCPGECDPVLESFLFGQREAMEKYRNETTFNKDAGLAKYSEALVDAAIAAKPETVGPPVDILHITRQGTSWAKVKPECRK